jgi:hypothetical protein
VVTKVIRGNLTALVVMHLIIRKCLEAVPRAEPPADTSCFDLFGVTGLVWYPPNNFLPGAAIAIDFDIHKEPLING